MTEISRARPLLGTQVIVRVDGLSDVCAHAAIDRAFAAIETLHARLSFHDPHSEISRINREAARHPVALHPQTWRLLRLAKHLAELSQHAFNPCLGAELVALGVLPEPVADIAPVAHGCADDIALLSGCRLHLRRPVWIDLGGIAKGYAVDQALWILKLAGASDACVNAGGDLRLFGRQPQPLLLRATAQAPSQALALTHGALACSHVDAEATHLSGHPLNGSNGTTLSNGLSAAVIAPCAWLADALTKVVLTDPNSAGKVVARWQAQALLQLPDGHWQPLS